MTKKATLTITMDLGEASAADPARAAGALEALTDRLLSGRFDGNQDHELRDAKGERIGTWRWGEVREGAPDARELGNALLFIDAANKKNPNACTDVHVDFARGTTPSRGMWGASGTFVHRAGISLSTAITAAAEALGWKRS